MEQITPFDWHRLFLGDEPPLYLLEIVFRVVLVYVFAALVMRFMGKRGNRKMSPFTYVVIISLGSATGDTMFYPKVPILYAWLVIVVVVILDNLMATAQLHSKGLNSFLEGDPSLLIFEGEIVDANLKQVQLRRDEFLGMLREQAITDTGEVRYAFLERTGQLGLFRYDKGEGKERESTYPEKVA